MSHWSNRLVALGACFAAVEWAKTQKSYPLAWARCPRADWLLWLLGKLSTDESSRKKLVLAACTCARTALAHVPRKEKRPLRAIQAAERWVRGKATIEEVLRARDAAYAYAYADAAADAAANAAYAAAYAAADADAAANAAANAASYANAAYAAYAAAYAADYAADSAAYAADSAASSDASSDAAYAKAKAKAKALRSMARIVRSKCARPELPAEV